MAILGLRQRNRYRQCRRLGFQVPESYIRVKNIRLLPAWIQEELLKYPDTINEDSSYEDDNQLMKKYKHDPMAYIIAEDQQKKEALEQGGEPTRLNKARRNKGDGDITKTIKKIKQSVMKTAFEEAGITYGRFDENQGTQTKAKLMSREETMAESNEARKKYEK